MLELYHAEPRANSMKPLILLKEKGVAFESHYVNLLKFEQHEPWFVKINPNGQVPVLIHDGAVINESTVINEYLDEVFPEVPLRPESPVERAHMRIWTKFVDEYFCPALSMIGWHRMVRQIATAVPKDEFEKLLARIPLQEQRDKWATVAGDSFSQEQLDDSRRKLGVSAQRMEKTLSESPWLAGSTYSLADIAAFPMASGMPEAFPDLANVKDTPRLMAWIEKMNARPGVQAALAMPDKVAETMKEYGVV